MPIDAHDVPNFESFDGDIYLRHDDLPAAEWALHAHAWGQINYVSKGVMQIEVEGRRFISPPHYAVWIPPNLRHRSYNAVPSVYRSAYLSVRKCERMPVYACAISVSELLKAVLNEFARLNVRSPGNEVERAMALVALDQIESASIIDGYLPYPKSDGLRSILEDVENNLKNKRSTEEIAKQFHMTARTLERKCMLELGMGFGEWQHRLRHMKAIQGLEKGVTIQQISWDLGYASSSSFIKMFKRLTGVTPDQYRSEH